MFKPERIVWISILLALGAMCIIYVSIFVDLESVPWLIFLLFTDTFLAIIIVMMGSGMNTHFFVKYDLHVPFSFFHSLKHLLKKAFTSGIVGYTESQGDDSHY